MVGGRGSAERSCGWMHAHFQPKNIITKTNPQFYNENTGETTWDQPVPTFPSPEERRDEQVSPPGRMGNLPRRGQRRELPLPTEDYSTASEIPADKRGWFGFSRGAAKPQRQEMKPQGQAEMPNLWETRGAGAGLTDSSDYDPSKGSGGRVPPHQQSTEGRFVGSDTRFRDELAPAYVSRQGVSGSAAGPWVGEDDRGTAEPWESFGDSSASQVEVQQPSRPAEDPTVGGNIGIQEGIVIGVAERDARVSEDQGISLVSDFDAATGAAEAYFLQPGDRSVLPMETSRSGNLELRAGDAPGAGLSVLDIEEQRTSGALDVEEGAGAIDSALEGGSTGASLHDGGVATVHELRQEAATAHKPERAEIEASGERTTPSHETPKAVRTEEAATGANERLSQSTSRGINSRREDEASSPWRQDTFGAATVGERQRGDKNTEPAGERRLYTETSYASRASPSGVIGDCSVSGKWQAVETDAVMEQQGGGSWGNGYPSQRQLKHMREEEACKIKDTKEDKEGWDWADPWGQEAAWGASAWDVGTTQETRLYRDSDAVPTPGTPPKRAIYTPPDPERGGGVRGSWGTGTDQTGAGFHSAGTATVGVDGDAAVATVAAARRKELEELARALTETREELENAREVEEGLRSALRAQEEAKASTAAAASAAGERAKRAEALVKQREEEARENATAVGQWLVTLGLEQQSLRGQLVAEQSNSTLLTKELVDLRETAKKAELRGSSSEAKLKVALEDVAVLDEGLKQYMDGDGQRRTPRPSHGIWRRVSEAYLHPLLPSKLKTPSLEEREVDKLNRTLGRALENNTALAEAVKSKDELVSNLNSRIKQFQLQAVRRKKGYRALKLGLADLTREVQSKESMAIILVVAMVRTASILDQTSAVIFAQREGLESLASLSRDRQEKVQSLSREVENGATRLARLQESLHRADSALCTITASLGAGEDYVERWKEATDQVSSETGPQDSMVELLRELHVAVASKFINPLGLEPSTGAITVAIPRTVSDQVDAGGVARGQKTFWRRLLDCLCCRRVEERGKL